ncbi:MAG: MarR family transcriptional regulator [Cyclobacteriaceae bacterium]
MNKDDLYQVIPFLIEQISKRGKRYSQREFDERGLGVTIDQWVLLKIVQMKDGISQRELAERSFRDGASITRSLDLLEKKGLIQRNSIPENRRQYSITICKEGVNFIQENMEMIDRHRKQFVDGFSSEEIGQLKGYLNRMMKNLE